MSDDDTDPPQLSAETLTALQEFLLEQSLKKDDSFEEDWQLSQFWYDEFTSSTLSRTALAKCNGSGNIALLSCPTLYKPIKSLAEQDVNVKLFEFDKRFSALKPDFIFYDYNDPLNLSLEYKNSFDVIIADPPFLSEECLTKISETINFLRKDNSKIVLCTGAVMEPLANDLLQLKKCSFRPKHKNNLANEFICLSNFGEMLES